MTQIHFAGFKEGNGGLVDVSVTAYTALETEGAPEVALSLNSTDGDVKYEAIADMTLPQAKALAAAIMAIVEHLS